MATIHIDGKDYDVDGADNLLQACLSLGLDVPYFCWHPALGSVGSCRQCAVKVYKDKDDTRGTLVMSCMTGIKDDAYISIDDAEAVEFRESVVEWLMSNHPHDCPVCAEGGHCHLQDMTVMTGHSRRRYRFTKRTHENQYLGPFIAHEMNRCIACYRCVRYYKDYAGGTDLGVYGAHDNVYFGRETDGVLESEFSGNLTEVCPTGVFTDQTHTDHYTRKWDLQFAPSICHGCAVGCNISPGERYGEVRRIENRYNGTVNHYFLCDRGRFGYGYVNRDDRPRQPWLLTEEGPKSLSLDTALDTAAARLRRVSRVIGIGSPRASLESNHALKLLVGEENFSTGIAADELERLQLMLSILQEGALPTPSLRDIEQFDAVVVLGEDLTQTAARVALAVRQVANNGAKAFAANQKIPGWHANAVNNVAQGRKYPVFLACVSETKLDDVARDTFHGTPDEIARVGFAIAHALDTEAPLAGGMEDHPWVEQVAEVLRHSKRPLIIAGESLASSAVIKSAANLARALKHIGKEEGGLSLICREANSLGLAMLDGQSLDWALKALTHRDADAAIVLENDLYQRAPTHRVDEALEATDTLIVLDHQRTATMTRADIAFPAASFAEGDGTLVNHEGRAQRFFQVYDPRYYRPEDMTHEGWRWLRALHATLEELPTDWNVLDDATRACAQDNPLLNGIIEAAPNAEFRIKGLKISRQPHRASGRTSMRANIDISEPRQPQDLDSPLSFSMEGYNGYQIPRSEVPFAWAPGWNSPQAWNRFQDEVGGHLKAGDPGVRLISATTDAQGYFTDIPNPFQLRYDRWQVVPLYHLFGSEAMTARARPIQERMPNAYVALGHDDVEALHLEPSAKVQVTIGRQQFNLPLRVSEHMRRGAVGLPIGIDGLSIDLAGRLAGLEQEVQA
ncbi:NADH-quinone oxidoreductase subunit NuoG [Zymobacter sp. IVIA_5232.4 C2]|uniref:NADH-quinone oxidoreductase subunit NuoG n=1 Tax=Zymobacter sp. IVIA_5232.4 C2 TaxID=3394855 RepID=UPI0039C25298